MFSVDEKSSCAGHRHEEIIENQREALLELRARVRVLEEQAKDERNTREWRASAGPDLWQQAVISSAHSMEVCSFCPSCAEIVQSASFQQ